jgi:hypothetical protein
MPDSSDELLSRIRDARPTNEAEVETKIVLHLLRLLGYTETDRADKPTIPMQFGRERMNKEPDFIIYDGAERAVTNALLTVEAKAPGVDMKQFADQVISYAVWAGTPCLLMCNGTTIAISRYVVGAKEPEWFTFALKTLEESLEKIRGLVGRSAALLFKERISFFLEYLPKIGDLHPREFLREYLERLRARFQLYAMLSPLEPPRAGQDVVPDIPIHVRWERKELSIVDSGIQELSDIVTKRPIRLAIQGAPGSGKSTLCRRLAHVIADTMLRTDTGIIPIFVDLSRGFPGSRKEAFAVACKDIGVRHFPELFDRSLEKARSIIILDGLDETRSSPTNSERQLQDLLSEIGDQSLLLTSRPHAMEPLRDMLRQREFRFGHVRDLLDEELRQILHRYIRDTRQSKSLLARSESGGIPDLHTPLIALMAIRVANELPEWATLSTFALFEKYIRVLHRFFNATTTRGRDLLADESATLCVHAQAAELLHASLHSGRMLTFEALRVELEKTCSPDSVLAWLNCGIATSRLGEATFVHESFSDFGFAYSLITAFRETGCAGLMLRNMPSGAYPMAASALTENDNELLSQCLEHASPRVRTRAINLLKHHTSSPVIIELVARLFDKEPSPKVRRGMASIMIEQSDGASEWLRERLFVSDRRQRRMFATLMRRTRSTAMRTQVLLMAETRVKKFALAAFHLAVQAEDLSQINRLVSLYARMGTSAKTGVCDELEAGDPTTAGTLARNLIPIEPSPEFIIRLLNCILMSKNDGLLDDAVLTHATEILSAVPRFGRGTLRRFRKLGRLISLVDTDRAAVKCFVEVCNELSQRTN